MRRSHKRRRIAPRLASGDSRVPFGHGLPEAIKLGLKAIAELENQSMSWVLEQLIADWLCSRRVVHVDRPEYVRRKSAESQPEGRLRVIRRKAS